MSVFSFLDSISEVKKNESLTAFFELKGDEEFLKDHFQDFPVMPGVLLIESLKQAASCLLSESRGGKPLYRFGSIGSVKYGQFVKPGNLLRIFVRLLPSGGDPHFEGRMDLVDGPGPPSRAILADFTLVPA